MRRFALLCACAGLLLAGGCAILPKSDPTLANRSAYWYRHTDPAKFFAHESSRGRVYFLGVFDPEAGGDSPAPGISRGDPAFRVARTGFVPKGPFVNPRRAQEYVAAVRRFAERYNPLVLAYLHEHPDAGKEAIPRVN